jgi:hypothetical protein|tara:strand:+ start:661 stop:846 length:186 start_codon:yes stop_codon:yes gene_type:complete
VSQANENTNADVAFDEADAGWTTHDYLVHGAEAFYKDATEWEGITALSIGGLFDGSLQFAS